MAVISFSSFWPSSTRFQSLRNIQWTIFYKTSIEPWHPLHVMLLCYAISLKQPSTCSHGQWWCFLYDYQYGERNECMEQPSQGCGLFFPGHLGNAGLPHIVPHKGQVNKAYAIILYTIHLLKKATRYFFYAALPICSWACAIWKQF